MWFLLAVLLISAVYSPAVYFQFQVGDAPSNKELFFGVTFGGNTTSEAKLLIDKVKGYTNLFVVDSWDICARPNGIELTEICEYAVNANMNVMVFFSFIYWNSTRQVGDVYNSSSWEILGIDPWHVPWLNTAKERWGDKFLGVYLYDEPGGKQIDKGYWGGNNVTRAGNPIRTFENASDYSDAANIFVNSIVRSGSMQHVTNISAPNSVSSPTPVFTSDNALYWFDYLSGYDAVFAELGWNHNEAQHIALCRGAANVQNKQWGAIIAWAQNEPPYLPSGTEMYQELLTAYRAGAKYLLVFNFPQINPYGAFTEEHFDAMKAFWSMTRHYPRSVLGTLEGEVAFVLPKDYGWGMRQPNDRIWGLWPADDLSPQIGERISTLIKTYGFNLDIVYDDQQFNLTEKYSTIYYWNSTTPLHVSSAPIVAWSNELYVTLLIASIAITCIPSYMILKKKKGRQPKAVLSVSVSKASLANLGRGKLEFAASTLRFYREKGYFRKRREIAGEIPMADVESMKCVGSEFSVTRKGATDVFVVEDTGLVGTINEKMTESLEEKRKALQHTEEAKQKRNEIAGILSVAVEITDSLFDVLRSLNGQVTWGTVESYSKRSEENGRNLMSQQVGAVSLDFTKLSLAVKGRLPKEASRETYCILRNLYEFFSGLASKNEFLDGIHPNYNDAKTAILAYYALNDVILGTIVGDEEPGRESNELVMLLEDLSKGTGVKINVDAIKDIVIKLVIEKGKESTIEEARLAFRQQIRDVMTDLGKT